MPVEVPGLASTPGDDRVRCLFTQGRGREGRPGLRQVRPSAFDGRGKPLGCHGSFHESNVFRGSPTEPVYLLIGAATVPGR